jgi:tetratricopeptide (TPR) repeat protein
LCAANLDTAITLYSEKKYEEASEVFLSLLNEPGIADNEKAKANFYLGKIELLSENPDKDVALNYFSEAFYSTQGEVAGDSACEMALILQETDQIKNAAILFERLYNGKIHTSDETFGRAAYNYGLFAVRQLKDRNLARDILYNLDSGKTKAPPEYVNNGRYTLGHILAKDNNFKEAYIMFNRTDYSDREINRKADKSLQIVWTFMEHCRKLSDAGETDPEFTFQKARDLCKGVSDNFAVVVGPGIPEKFKTYFAVVSDLMHLETYWYDKQYEMVPPLVEQFFEKYGPDDYRKRELAMARFWSAASYHKMGNFDEAFNQFDLLQEFDETAQGGFMNIPAYALLIKADCYYGKGDDNQALSYLDQCLEKHPEFTRRRVSMKDSFPVYCLFDRLNK